MSPLVDATLLVLRSLLPELQRWQLASASQLILGRSIGQVTFILMQNGTNIGMESRRPSRL